MPKISVIMAAYNSEATIGRAIQSFKDQNYQDKELIIIDGMSIDRTCAIVEEFKDDQIKIFSERDDGIYDAINKGINLSSGDTIGILHSNDIYPHGNVLSDVVAKMDASNLDAIYGDVDFFKREPENTFRQYKSHMFTPAMLKYGIMPAHPTLFLRRSVFDNYGIYRTDLRIAADFDFVARIFKSSEIAWQYVPTVWMKMEMGGVSTSGLRSTIKLNREILKACRSNGIHTSWGHILLRYSWKILEFSAIRKALILK